MTCVHDEIELKIDFCVFWFLLIYVNYGRVIPFVCLLSVPVSFQLISNVKLANPSLSSKYPRTVNSRFLLVVPLKLHMGTHCLLNLNFLNFLFVLILWPKNSLLKTALYTLQLSF